MGDLSEARVTAMNVRQTSGESYILGRAGVALALADDTAGAQKLVADLNRRFPQNTFVQAYYLPTIRAALALHQSNPQDAVENLSATAPYDSMPSTGMIAVYLRGVAYLGARQGPQAAGEFQKLLDDRGRPSFVNLFDWGSPQSTALAQLGLARAYTLQGDTAKARAAYQDFFALWKDADPDIPVLKQAKAEYAKL
jgi:eukaryotic-like serine/threonine-protein kinase